MRNGNLKLIQLRKVMFARLDQLDAAAGKLEFDVNVLKHDVKRLGKAVRTTTRDLKDVIDTIFEMDHELKVHQRDRKAHVEVE